MTKLGQHFLINKNKLKKIVEALELKPGDTVIEIGPGHGELTLLLARNFQFPISNFQTIAIEKDKELIEDLEFRIKDLGLKNIKIIHGDALKILPKLVNSILRTSDVLRLKIVGNIPYYITGYLLRILGELKNKPSLIVLILQKEVAQRICATPPKMNLLAASVQFWAEPEIIDYIPKRDFRPVPQVDSAIIKLVEADKRGSMRILEADRRGLKQDYYRLIKALFKQPRKTILNNLINAELRRNLRGTTQKKEEVIKKLTKIGINPNDRPQNLTINQLIELSNKF